MGLNWNLTITQSETQWNLNPQLTLHFRSQNTVFIPHLPVFEAVWIWDSLAQMPNGGFSARKNGKGKTGNMEINRMLKWRKTN